MSQSGALADCELRTLGKEWVSICLLREVVGTPRIPFASELFRNRRGSQDFIIGKLYADLDDPMPVIFRRLTDTLGDIR
jgi:hypothetical protein